MNEDRLWAPWRMGYVTGSDAARAEPPLPEPLTWHAGAQPDCFLCRDAATYDQSSGIDRRLLVADRGTHTIVVLNRYPYNNGHVLIAPRRHVGELGEMNRDEHVECMEQIVSLTRVYLRLLAAEGFNVGLNLGRIAGAGLPGHLHWHLVPRWAGDNNFMPVLSDTRVIPQSLESLWELLTDSLGKDSGQSKDEAG